METTTEVREASMAMRKAGIALIEARHKFRLAHAEFLIASGMEPSEARRLAFEYERQR